MASPHFLIWSSATGVHGGVWRPVSHTGHRALGHQQTCAERLPGARPCATTRDRATSDPRKSPEETLGGAVSPHPRPRPQCWVMRPRVLGPWWAEGPELRAGASRHGLGGGSGCLRTRH